jgi:DNA helicase-2/ATP-dependent DNA helicase PcrA
VHPLDGLNPEQRRAVETVRGPVAILAGAGSGKTTTITRRIAWQVASGAFRPEELLAVTFTDRAAGELKARLSALGVAGVEARTFHSAALAQLRRVRPEAVGRILPTKALVLRQIANGLPMPFKFRPAADLATEIERAKARRVRPDGYLDDLNGHEPPIPPDLMLRVYREYERRKDANGQLDFEDLLERTVTMFEEDADARERIQARFTAFTVDEYQDVNDLQQALLDLWLGDRDELCVVGDDYQSIYAFTGASPRWLLDVPKRFPHAAVIRLEENYRSSPEVLELANRLVPRLQGAEKVLRPARPSGPAPVAEGFATPADEDAWVVARVRALDGVPLEEVAILCRTNARLADFEEELHDAGIPFQGSSLLGRDAARRLVRQLERSDATDVAARVRGLAVEAGWLPSPPDKLGERELTRQADLARLVQLGAAFEGTCAEFVADLRRRFDRGGEGAQGIQLLTYHRAKGLEFEAVFLPRLNDKELPSKLARTPDEQAEERRLLYVGLTRAKRHLVLSWSGKASPFVAELGLGAALRSQPKPKSAAPDDPLYAALAGWRLARARSDAVPPYVVFHNSVLEAIAGARPHSHAELARIAGVGPAKLDRYGDEVLAVVAAG